jgi:hypothetical protein
MADNLYVLTIYKHRFNIDYGRYTWVITSGRPPVVNSVYDSGRPNISTYKAIGHTYFKFRAAKKMRRNYSTIVAKPGGGMVWQQEVVG